MSIDPLAIVPTVTNVGLAACFRAQGDGLYAELSHVGIGRGLPDGGGWKGYVPSRTQTALVREDVRVPILSGTVLDGEGFRILAEFPATTDGSETPVRELAFYLKTGQPLAIWSEVAPWPFAARNPRVGIHLAMDLYLAQVPLSALTLVVEQPDIPDMTAANAMQLAASTTLFIAQLKDEWRFPLTPRQGRAA
ncbi:phage tail protein [Methylobacterium aquaticum]|uniref:phage tail protein n=1 Tax=Methylobacterium aquaticum TaxID=270351 RepID=UPI0019313CFA|nr:phage tail protein [Methylobacterium aquaticum]QRE74379.1 phage tail protein [Methylobacterium aquaticum]